MSPADLESLTSVCSSWRDIILKSPRFWHAIDSRHGLHSCLIVLTRSRPGPLDVCLRGYEAPWYRTDLILYLTRLITPESSRIRSLHFTVGPGTPTFQPFFQTASLSSLTSLTARVMPETHVPVSIHVSSGVPFRHLDLSSVSIPWETPRLHGLEILSLSNLHRNSPTMTQLHHILRSSPFLRKLSLDNWKPPSMPGDWQVPGHRSWTTEEISPIFMPRLASVEVQTIPDTIHSGLLSMLTVPSLKKVLWTGADDVTFASGPALLRMAAQCIKASPELVITWDRRSRMMSIVSEKCTSTSEQQVPVEACNLVNLSIETSNISGLIEQVAKQLNSSNSILLTTNSKHEVKRFRELLLHSGALFEVNLSMWARFWD